MEARVSARLSPGEGRRFGFAVGGAFLALAGLVAWRGHPLEARVFMLAGGALVLAALAAPTRLGPVQRAWMRLAAVVSRVTTPVVLGVIYFLIVTPTGWLRRLLGGSRLTHSPDAKTFWADRPADTRRRMDMERQF
jgi:hypothetical protein